MKTKLQTKGADISDSTGLKRTIDRSYSRLIKTAKRAWDRDFGGKDPSDACVNVRISSVEADAQCPSIPCAGILRKRRSSLVSGKMLGLLP